MSHRGQFTRWEMNVVVKHVLLDILKETESLLLLSLLGVLLLMMLGQTDHNTRLKLWSWKNGEMEHESFMPKCQTGSAMKNRDCCSFYVWVCRQSFFILDWSKRLRTTALTVQQYSTIVCETHWLHRFSRSLSFWSSITIKDYINGIIEVAKLYLEFICSKEVIFQ